VPTLVAALEQSALTLWIGGIWTIGYVVAPVLFLSLPDRMMAGDIAGRLFRISGIIGLVCGLLLLAGAVFRDGIAAFRRWRAQALAAMLAITVVGQFGLLPVMERLKSMAGGRLIAGSPIEHRFELLHGVSSTLFLVNSVLGLALVIRGLRLPAEHG